MKDKQAVSRDRAELLSLMDVHTAVAFLTQFYEDTAHDIELRAFSQNGGKNARLFSRDPKEIEEFLVENANLKQYFGVATREGGGGTKEHCRELPALFADVDFKMLEEADAWKSLKAFPLKPSLVIKSGGGLHVYWLLKKPADASDPKLEAILRGVVEQLHADRNCAEIAHVLRPPGILNWKYKPPRRAVIAEANWDRRYDLADFAKFEIEKTPASAISRNADGLVPVGARYDYLLKRAGEYRRKGDSEDVALKKVLLDYEMSCGKSPADGREGLRQTAEMVKRVYKSYPSVENLAEKKPEIIVAVGENHRVVTEAEKVLLRESNRLGVFQRAGQVVQVFRIPGMIETEERKVPEGTLMIEAVEPVLLRNYLDRLMVFKIFAGLDKEGNPKYKPINCPDRVAKTYLVLRGHWKLPVLTGTLAAPVMRSDGTILFENGYDTKTGLYLDTEMDWLPVKETPTLEDAREALRTLAEPFEQFPFPDGDDYKGNDYTKSPDYAVVLAAIPSALQARLLPAVPLFAFDAPKQRTGKTLLAEAVAIIACGREAPSMAASLSSEEFRKALTASLVEGQLITNLDNLEHPLKSPFLAQIITSKEFKDRELGKTKNLILPTNSMWTATGNNVSFVGDMAVRVLKATIDAGIEQPETREFKIRDLKGYLKDRRREMVHAALTILRAFHVAGRPKQQVPEWGGFEKWSRLVREAMVWAGTSDPVKTKEAAMADDPEEEAGIEVLKQLDAKFGDNEFESREFEEYATAKNEHGAYRYPEARGAMAAVAERKGVIDRYKWSCWMKRWKNRPANGMKLVRVNKTKPAKWQIARVK